MAYLSVELLSTAVIVFSYDTKLHSTSSVHGSSLGKNTGVDSYSLLQRIFPTQGSNPDLPHCRQTLYRLNMHSRSYIVIQMLAPNP